MPGSCILLPPPSTDSPGLTMLCYNVATSEMKCSSISESCVMTTWQKQLNIYCRRTSLQDLMCALMLTSSSFTLGVWVPPHPRGERQTQAHSYTHSEKPHECGSVYTYCTDVTWTLSDHWAISTIILKRLQRDVFPTLSSSATAARTTHNRQVTQTLFITFWPKNSLTPKQTGSVHAA